MIQDVKLGFGGFVKHRRFGKNYGRYVRCLPLVLGLLFLTSAGFASPLCTTATLDTYIPGSGTFSCSVVAGLGVDLKFTFHADSFTYSTDGTQNFFANNILVTPVTGPGLPEGGFKFSATNLTVPGDGTSADVNVYFDVAVDSQPLGFSYRLHSAHFAMTDFRGTGAVFALESEASGAFALEINDPPGTPIPDAIFAPRTGLQPTTDIFFRPNSQIFDWTTTYDLVNIPEPGSLVLIPGALLLLTVLRKKSFLAGILPVLAMMTLLAAKSHASALCTDLAAINGSPVSPGTTSLGLDKYIAYSTANGGCLVNDMFFDFLSFSPPPVGANTGSPLASAATTKLSFNLNMNTGTNTATVQLRYVPIATTASSEDQTFTFQYTVTAPTFLVTQMQGSTTASSGVEHTTTITPNASPSPVVSPVPLITLNGPLNTMYTVTESIHMPNSVNGLHISGLTETFTEVTPEPVTSVLMGGALLGLGLLSKRRRQA
jgi:hypothetical protein